VDFSTYNTQILCLTGAIISIAHNNDKYKYVQRCEGICPLQYVTYFRKKEYVYDMNAAVWLISTDIHDSLFLFQPDKAVSSVLSGPINIKLSAVCYKYYSLFKGEVTHGKVMQDGSQFD
jgi:hypothetical protein